MNDRTYVVATSANEPMPLIMQIPEYLKTLTHDIYKTQVLAIGTKSDCQTFMDDPAAIHSGSGACYVSKGLFDKLVAENVTGRFWTVNDNEYIGVNLMGYKPIERERMVSIEECLYFLLSDCSETTRVIEPDQDDDNYIVVLVRPDIDRVIEATLRFILIDRDDPEVLGQASRLLENLTHSLSNSDNKIFIGSESFRTLVTVVRVTGSVELEDRVELLISELANMGIEDPFLE